ncbi:MAG TPA: dUTP diphosphatase [Patescibacteria group bacterium]|nr:dUTP diphosphatase [Patescibacteria group bacterium]
MKILIQKLHSDAKIPAYAHADDAGMDIYTVVEVTLQPGERKAVATGIAMQIPNGCVGLIWDKSGRALHDGIHTLSGVVDAGYRGEIKVIVLNVSSQPVTILAGEKIAQLLIQSVLSPIIEEVLQLDESSTRGIEGFGSTGLV